MPHKRTPEAKQRREVRKATRKEQKQEANNYLWRYVFPDQVVREIACRSDRNDIEDHLIQAFGYGNYDASVVPIVVKGVILKDSRGKGSFQT